LTSKNYAAQAKWFLNAFWEKGLKDKAEDVFKYYNLFVKLDEKKRKMEMSLMNFLATNFLKILEKL